MCYLGLWEGVEESENDYKVKVKLNLMFFKILMFSWLLSMALSKMQLASGKNILMV